MGERGTWEIVLDPDIIAGRIKARPFGAAFLHEVGHIALGHVLPRHITDADRAAARVKYAADMPAILAHADKRERAADAWAAAMAPVVDAWCQREYGMSFDAAARMADF